MPPDNLSAFAKRRRLNNGASTQVVDTSTAARSESPKPEKSKVIRNTRSVVSSNQSENELSSNVGDLDDQPHSQQDNGNSFEPLVTANSVGFSGFREFEQLGDCAVKIRLSQGQRCTISGAARLWIRCGSVSVYSATLRSSSTAYTIYAPSTHPLPSIVSQTKTSEFQLESIQDVQPYLKRHLRNPWIINRNGDTNSLSFSILGVTDLNEHESSDYPSSSTNAMMRALQKHFSRPGLTKQDPIFTESILIHGRSSSSLSYNCVMALNYLLTLEDEKHEPLHPQGIYLLDLDSTHQEFGLPGTVSLVYIMQPVLGPSHTHPWHSTAVSHRILASYWIGQPDGKSHLRRLEQATTLLLHEWHYDRKLKLVVKAAHYLDRLETTAFQQVKKLLRWNIVLTTDQSGQAEASRLIREATEDPTCDLIHLGPTNPSTTSSEAVNRFILQSYLHTIRYVDGHAFWTSQAVLCEGQATMVLNYGHDSSLIQFLAVNAGILRPEDLREALQNNFVYVVYQEAKKMAGALDCVSSASHHSYRNPEDNSLTCPFGELIEVSVNSAGFGCLGMAVVQNIDEKVKAMKLCTPLSLMQVEEVRKKGNRVGLLLEKPWLNGSLDSDWLLTEFQ